MGGEKGGRGGGGEGEDKRERVSEPWQPATLEYARRVFRRSGRVSVSPASLGASGRISNVDFPSPSPIHAIQSPHTDPSVTDRFPEPFHRTRPLFPALPTPPPARSLAGSVSPFLPDVAAISLAFQQRGGVDTRTTQYDLFRSPRPGVTARPGVLPSACFG
ncbi:hypothetical protein AcV7_007466 [Taiwanofungus camphoratus]|nr:hypothetical protein AcV7_007466 [Antrodia cinnamomea]